MNADKNITTKFEVFLFMSILLKKLIAQPIPLKIDTMIIFLYKLNLLYAFLKLT